MNRETLKECIADAKTIRETAIASAKAALEEAFTPQLTAMFAEKLNEMEKEEEMEKSKKNETYSMKEEEELDETFNLDELLAELEMEEGYSMEEEGMEKENMMEDEDLDENIMLEEMSDEEIEELVMKTIEDMIASGKLMAGEEAEEEAEEEGEEEEIEVSDEEEIDEINIDELLAEMEDVEEGESIPSMNEEEESLDEIVDWTSDYINNAQILAALAIPASIVGIAAKDYIKMAATKLKDKAKGTIDTLLKKQGVEPPKEKTSEAKEMEVKAEAKEMEETINELRNELNEVNLLNAKLLYTNKIFKAKNLTESEKIKVLNTFDKAETVKEVKLVFETLTESLKASAKKTSIKESLGSSSKTIAPAAPKQPIIEVNDAFARMQRLAGLKK